MNNYQLYRHRSVSDNVNMVFDFVGENWKKWLKMMVYFLLPFSVILGIVIATFYSDTETSMSSTAYVLFIVLFILGSAVATALEMLLIQWYETHGGTLDGCNMATMWRMMPGATLRCLLLIVTSLPILLLSVLAIIIPIAGLAAIFAVLPVFLSAPIMMLEPKDSLLNVIKRAFSLGYKKWGALILISLIMGLVGFLLNNATTFPLGMLVSLKELLVDPNTGSVFWSFVTDIATYVLCVAGSFISFIEMGLFIHAITCHYGSVPAEVEDIDLDNDIDNFAQLK